MINNGARWTPLIAIALCGLLGAPRLDAAPDAPEEPYFDPDNLVSDAARIGYFVWPGGLAAFEGRPYEVAGDRGLVGAMDPAGPWVYIDGQRFAFAVDADIRLRVGAGAPTLLAKDMALEYYYAPARPGEQVAGRIIAAIELEEGAIPPR